jgi:hypothetical protein
MYIGANAVVPDLSKVTLDSIFQPFLDGKSTATVDILKTIRKVNPYASKEDTVTIRTTETVTPTSSVTETSVAVVEVTETIPVKEEVKKFYSETSLGWTPHFICTPW